MSQLFAGILTKLRQPRTLWLLLLAVLLCVVFGYALWDQLWRDTTTRYVRADAAFYVRVSIPKYYATTHIEQGVDMMLDDLKLPIDARDIKRELAFVRYHVGTSSVDQVIIRSDRLSKVEAKLRASSLIFKRLSGEHVIIGLDQQILLPLQNQEFLDIKNTQGKSLVVYLAPSTDRDQSYLTQLFVGAASEPTIWYGEARRGSFAIYSAQTTSLPSVESPTSGHSTITWSDSQVSFSRYAEIMDELKQGGEVGYVPDIDPVLRDQVFSHASLVAVSRSQATMTTGWGIADYDWRLTLIPSTELTPQLQTAIERVIASTIAFELPQPATRRLSDGTAVTVIRPDAGNWEFTQESDAIRILDVPERNVRITAIKSNEGLVITNAKDYTFPDLSGQTLGNLPASLLPETAPWKYLKAFSVLSVDNSGVILR